jgi:hypothetical protein
VAQDTSGLLALQRLAGNRAVTSLLKGHDGTAIHFVTWEKSARASTVAPGRRGQLCVQRDPGRFQTVAGDEATRGEIKVEFDESKNLIVANGHMYGKMNKDVYDPSGSEKVPVKGMCQYKIATVKPEGTFFESRTSFFQNVMSSVGFDAKILVISTISATKRTSIGPVLAYEAASVAPRTGCQFVGTELSALEEGTPEFYKKIGLLPTKLNIANVDTSLAGMQAGPTRAQARDRMLWAGELRGETSDVLEKAKAAALARWRAVED